MAVVLGLCLLRAWDVYMGSAPLLASWLVGRFLWRRLTRSRRDLPADSWSASLLTGAACLQLLTWVGALFSPPFMRVLQVAVIAAGAIALAVLVRPRSRPDAPARLAMPEDPLAAAAALLGLVSGFFLAGTYIPNSIPADAIAYHVPISVWFGRGGAWSRLAQHTWNAQWPLASSLWSSFGLAAKDRLVVWSAQNYAFLAWTAAVLFDVVRSLSLFESARRRWRTFAAGCLALSLLVGAYSGYQSLGFVDYRFGLFAAALAGVLLRMPLTWRTAPVALALASCPAEFRPQGLLLTAAILVWWAGFQALKGGDERKPDRTDVRRAAIPIALAGVLFAKWWLLVWVRWGTPAPPLFARWWNLRETEKYADEVFQYLWASDPDRGLDLLFLGTAETWPLTILVWGLLLLVAVGVARALREKPRPGLAAQLILMLAPVAACAFVATQVPSEAPRMIAPMLPALLLILTAVVAATPRPSLVAGLLFLFAFITASLATAPLPWRRPHAGAAYVSSTTFAFDRVERELAGLHAERPLVFNQYIPFLPGEFRQMGVTYGPWATFPRVPLRTQQAWMRWLNENGIRTLVVEKGKALENTWEWAGDRPTTPDFRVLDRWIAGCPGRRVVGQWIACPVPTGFERPGSDRQKKRE